MSNFIVNFDVLGSQSDSLCFFFLIRHDRIQKVHIAELMTTLVTFQLYSNSKQS